MAMKQEVALDAVELRRFRPILGLLYLCFFFSQQHHRWDRRFNDEGFARPKAPSVNILTGKLPTHSVWMKVVPVRADVEVEDVPTNALSGAANDGGRVPDKTAAVYAVARNGTTMFIRNYRGHYCNNRHIGLPEGE